ncbi:hypothetical protein EYC59_02795 [Candidatus Saccharibacteria bacterium]|nr:MAG: hypothetical protein EYC59_02795 [Candidatus Saccharibacteria bacterium]
MIYTERVLQRSKQNWQRIALFITLGMSVAALGLPVSASAATKQLYLTPGSTIVSPNSTITVDVRANPGTPIDAVEATIAYNPSFFKYLSTDTTGSVFPVELPTTTTSTSVTVTRGIFLPDTVKSDSLVARVTFKVLARTTVTTLKLTGNMTYQGAYVTPTTASTTVRIQN